MSAEHKAWHAKKYNQKRAFGKRRWHCRSANIVNEIEIFGRCVCYAHPIIIDKVNMARFSKRCAILEDHFKNDANQNEKRHNGEREKNNPMAV